jgi:hypothetical protein
MPRESYVFRDGKMIPKRIAAQATRAHRARVRSALPSPAVIGDGMREFASPIDGRVFDSKRAWEKHVKANGHEIVGTDAPTASERYLGSEKHERSVAEDIVAAFDKLEQGYTPEPELKASDVGLDVSGITPGEYVRNDGAAID